MNQHHHQYHQPLISSSDVLQELEEYFRQSALTLKVPLPRWATW